MRRVWGMWRGSDAPVTRMGAEPRWELQSPCRDRSKRPDWSAFGQHHLWLFPGLNRARPLQPQYIHLKLRRLGLGALAGRNATRWANFVKRNWPDCIASRKDP